jgi:hypothetical protein
MSHRHNSSLPPLPFLYSSWRVGLQIVKFLKSNFIFTDVRTSNLRHQNLQPPFASRLDPEVLHRSLFSDTVTESLDNSCLTSEAQR